MSIHVRLWGQVHINADITVIVDTQGQKQYMPDLHVRCAGGHFPSCVWPVDLPDHNRRRWHRFVDPPFPVLRLSQLGRLWWPPFPNRHRRIRHHVCRNCRSSVIC